jgi:hypothetical protein
MPRFTSTLALLFLILHALLGAVVPAHAGSAPAPTDTATIEATAPIVEPSEAGVKAAIAHAVQKAARGALAMGFTWLHVQNAYVRPGYVGVQVVAMTRAPEDESEASPEPERPPAPPDFEPEGGVPREIRL